ncbi:hypothetical protein KFK14_23595 [Sphingobium phenoxybenzoativorans]|uniref:Uncharacterized protein n=1 Tax=Sphingobium phenoxybenzoativorans TaxID=1592790 RepID=A0A975Q1X4_9SPHN|nr:DUF5677 domain-containing protein [Sphingobium phenoxybenzoativorans]QUT05877.1 hypothetical protein KFK14_23595 [Sphingobium phenoxybenzoativorans]
MQELQAITEKYHAEYVSESFSSLEGINSFALTFYKDVAEIYDCITRLKNIERNPSGFSIDDAPVLGLLVRVWKLLKEVIKYYEQDNAEIISLFERPIIEASTIATYLLTSGPEVMLDYRKCSYKDRLRILRDLESGSTFFETKAGKRLLRSVHEKLDIEGFSRDDFKEQKSNRWKLQGKSFYDIFAQIEHADLYACTYGMMSESIHGSWNESIDWCLVSQDDGTYKTNPFSYPADIRFITPLLRFTTRPYRLWCQRIDVYDKNVEGTLNWVERVNRRLFQAFDKLFDPLSR